MPRKPKIKILKNARLATDHGGWLYCNNCSNTIAYLCHITYDSFSFQFSCKCGGIGSVKIQFDTDSESKSSTLSLVKSKNRLCCPNDNSPLFTIIEKNLKSYNYEIVCKTCHNIYEL